MNITTKAFLESVLDLLRETFEGSPEGEPSAYLDRRAGIFGTLDNLSAEQVSKNINGSSIVAHTEHSKFYLDRLCEFINGRTEKVNWEQSWLIDEVNAEEWDALRDAVRKSYTGVLDCIAQPREWTDDQVGMAIGMIAHTAYHLGAVRQMTKGV